MPVRLQCRGKLRHFAELLAQGDVAVERLDPQEGETQRYTSGKRLGSFVT
jgi:hypothetical protein